MARVIWDGEKIVIDSTRLNVEEVESVSKKYDGRKLPMSTYYEFPRSKDSIKAIGAISGIIMDDSFKRLYDIVIQKEEAKRKALEEKIESYNFPKILYPFQKQAVVEMIDISTERNVLLASQPGCGKTCMASIFLEKNENAFPCLIICPASLKVNWSKEIEKWIPGHSVFIINGRDSYADSSIRASVNNSDIVIINYDILGFDDKEASKKEKERIEKAKEEGRKYRKAFIPVKGWAVEFSNDFHFKTTSSKNFGTTLLSNANAFISISSNRPSRAINTLPLPFSSPGQPKK
jgi:SNF2 family DNA or RNA helicase